MLYPLPQWSRCRTTTTHNDPTYPEVRRRLGMTPALHPGLDLAGPVPGQSLGWPVVSIYYGTVTHARTHRVWGQVVVVHHPGLGVWSRYAHLLHTVVREGDTVMAGQVLGAVGSGDPAFSMAPHLHMDVMTRPLPGDDWLGMDSDRLTRDYLDPTGLFSKFAATETGVALEPPVVKIGEDIQALLGVKRV